MAGGFRIFFERRKIVMLIILLVIAIIMLIIAIKVDGYVLEGISILAIIVLLVPTVYCFQGLYNANHADKNILACEEKKTEIMEQMAEYNERMEEYKEIAKEYPNMPINLENFTEDYWEKLEYQNKLIDKYEDAKEDIEFYKKICIPFYKERTNESQN